MTDVVGVVSAVDAGSVTLETSSGPVTVRREVVVAVREIHRARSDRGRPTVASGSPPSAG